MFNTASRRKMSARLVNGAALVCFATFALYSTQAAPESVERIFAAHALSLRDSALLGEQRFVDVANRMPGSAIAGPEAASFLWSLSFPNMIVKLGRLRSEAPVSLYYDPLLDIAVLAFWERVDEGYHIKFSRTVPGTWLENSASEASLLPPWISEESALNSLLQTTADRLDAFTKMHPPEAFEGGRNHATFAEMAAGMRLVLPRLIWNANQRAQWTESSYQWLEPVVTEIELALNSANAQQMILAAPDTDPVTAEALAELPKQYVDELVLDLVVASPQNRLVFASSPADGDTYVIVICEIDASVCRLQRFLFLSLTD